MRTSELYSLEELKEAWPKGVKKILVVGAQRSGAGIASRILGEIFKIRAISEKEIDYDKIDMFFDLNHCYNQYVLQCPGLTFICHRLPVDMVIFMRRNYAETIASEKEIGWRELWAKYEVRKYFQRVNSDPITVKDRAWKFTQKEHLDKKGIPHFDLWYESLSTHPLWINKEDRDKEPSGDIRESEFFEQIAKDGKTKHFK